MDNEAIAHQLYSFGKREKAALARLQRVHEERCAFLCDLARRPGAALSADTITFVIEPKDDDEGGN